MHEAAKHRGQTIQTFLHSAAMKAIVEVEGEIKAEEEVGKTGRRRERGERRGLGIREQLQAIDEPSADREPLTDAPVGSPHITIQMPATTPSGGNDIATLARSIVEAPRYRRRTLMEAAIMRIARDARNEDEGRRLAAQLDEEIARMESKQTVMDRVRARRSGRRGT